MVFPLLGAIGGALFGSASAAAATIGVAGSLVSGAMGARAQKKAIARQNDYNDPVNIRERAEAAGFNPISFIGPGVGNQTATGGGNFMGEAIANSSMMVADAIKGSAEERARLENLRLENEKLQKEIQQMTLRPKTAGLYGTGGTIPLSPGVVKVPEFSPETHQGPVPMVSVWDANAMKWDQIPPGVADRLKIKDGQTMIAEDLTAWRGEFAGEATTLVKILDGATQPIQNWWTGTPKTKAPAVSAGPPASYQWKAPAKPGRLRLQFTGP